MTDGRTVTTDTHRSGSVWKYGGILGADWEICPFSVVHDLRREGRYNEGELARHAMTGVDPEFPAKVRPGDFVVGEFGVGYGHDHSHGCLALKGVGVSAVLCESASPFFLRNCFLNGLPLLEVPGIFEGTATGQRLVVDLVGGEVTNEDTGLTLRFPRLPGFMLDMLAHGGLYPMLKERLDRGELPRSAKGPFVVGGAR